MSERVKVQNMTRFSIGLKSVNNRFGYNIEPGTYRNLPVEDVEYNMAVAPGLFGNPPKLLVQSEELNEVAGIDASSIEIVNEDVAAKYLKGSVSKLRDWLTEHDEPHVRQAVLDAASKMDLPVSKAKLIKEFFPATDFTE